MICTFCEQTISTLGTVLNCDGCGRVANICKECFAELRENLAGEWDSWLGSWERWHRRHARVDKRERLAVPTPLLKRVI